MKVFGTLLSTLMLSHNSTTNSLFGRQEPRTSLPTPKQSCSKVKMIALKVEVLLSFPTMCLDS